MTFTNSSIKTASFIQKKTPPLNFSQISYFQNIYKEIFSKNLDDLGLKISIKTKRQILKAFLLERLHNLFCELYRKTIQQNQNNSSVECYTMDSQIIQILIREILETGEYTLEGIAYHTRIPLDVILDAASCGNTSEFSITPWIRIVSLYLQVKPEISQAFFEKLIEFKDRNHPTLLLLLNEL